MNIASSWPSVAALTVLLGLTTAPAAAESPQPSRVTLPGTAQIDDLPIAELSGLAWAADEQVLYAVSDLGPLLQFKIQIDGDELTAVQPLHAFELPDPDDVVDGGGKRFNAEGLTVGVVVDGQASQTELVAALEEKPPLIVRFNPDGKAVDTLAVPSPAWSPQHGVITAPESPLQGGPGGQHTVYAEGGQ